MPQSFSGGGGGGVIISIMTEKNHISAFSFQSLTFQNFIIFK